MTTLLQIALFALFIIFMMGLIFRSLNAAYGRHVQGEDVHRDYSYYDEDPYDDWGDEVDETSETSTTRSPTRLDMGKRRWFFRKNNSSRNHSSLSPLDDAPAHVIDDTARNLSNRDSNLHWWVERGMKDIEDFLTDPDDKN